MILGQRHELRHQCAAHSYRGGGGLGVLLRLFRKKWPSPTVRFMNIKRGLGWAAERRPATPPIRSLRPWRGGGKHHSAYIERNPALFPWGLGISTGWLGRHHERRPLAFYSHGRKTASVVRSQTHVLPHPGAYLQGMALQESLVPNLRTGSNVESYLRHGSTIYSHIRPRAYSHRLPSTPLPVTRAPRTGTVSIWFHYPVVIVFLLHSFIRYCSVHATPHRRP